MAVGHDPLLNIPPESEKAFKAYQSNLLSLISHELRTPLTSVLSSLQLLESDPEMESSTRDEVVRLAKKNANKLKDALDLLLDLADAETGHIQLKLGEVNLGAICRFKVAGKTADIEWSSFDPEKGDGAGIPALGDSIKLGRAVDLCWQMVEAKKETGSKVQVRISTSQAHWTFELRDGLETHWDELWGKSLLAERSGVASPVSAFAGALRSEEEFLNRMEEGLGAELVLAQQIFRLHEGMLISDRQGKKVALTMKLPVFQGEESLLKILRARIEKAASEMSSFCLGWIKIPTGVAMEDLRAYLKASLFRSTDGVYWVESRGLMALLLDDCSLEDAPRLLERFKADLSERLAIFEFQGAFAACPQDSMDAQELIQIALKRLGELR